MGIGNNAGMNSSTTTSPPKGLEFGHQGNLLSKGQNAPLLHTLAAVYAEVGKIAEAREMILKAMDQWGLEEPNPTC